jgi:hypothetical protein
MISVTRKDFVGAWRVEEPESKKENENKAESSCSPAPGDVIVFSTASEKEKEKLLATILYPKNIHSHQPNAKTATHCMAREDYGESTRTMKTPKETFVLEDEGKGDSKHWLIVKLITRAKYKKSMQLHFEICPQKGSLEIPRNWPREYACHDKDKPYPKGHDGTGHSDD